MLQKQKVSMPLIEGIETKTDPFQRQIGSVDNLENVIFDSPGRLKKRTGYDKLNTSLVDGSEIANAQKLAKYNNELCLFNKTNFYSYSESTTFWTNKGTVSNVFPKSKPILRNTYKQENIQSCHVAGIDAYAWEDGRNGIRIALIDNVTGNSLIADQEISASGILPKIEFIGNSVYFFYIEASTVKYRKVNPARPQTIEAAVTVVDADINSTDKIYDTTSFDNRIFIAWNSFTSSLKIRYLDENETLSAVQEEASETPSGCLGLSSDSSSRLLISYYDGTDVKILIRSYSLTVNLLAPTAVETIADIKNVTVTRNSSGSYTLYYEQSAASTYNYLIKQNTITLSGTAGTASVLIRSCGLASKSFMFESEIYVACLHQSTLQSTIFIINSNAEVVAKISPGLSGELLDFGNLPQAFAINQTTFLFSSQIKGRSLSENNNLFNLLGVNSSQLDFSQTVRFDNAELGEQLHTNGGIVQSYDGKEIVEHGFNLFPENITAGTSATTGGNMSNGTYQYVAVYSWIDNKGQQHFSAPSTPITVTLSGGGTTQTQPITVPTLRITEKSNIVIELYRTENVGTNFYKITSTSAPTYNNKTVNTVTITDTIADTALISNELLYTTGDVLDNTAPPSASIIESFGDRLFLAGLEDENKLQYSKIRTEGKPAEFNDTLTIDVNPRGGAITALTAMDDKLVIFKNNAIFYLVGDGPNNLGEQDNFINPELVTTDVGCVDQNSTVLTPLGIMFKSKKGIYLLDRSLSISYIGSPVELYNSYEVKSANLIESNNQVIFLTNSDALVYDYFVNKWVKFTNHTGISAINVNDKYYYIRNDSEIYVNSKDYTDNSSFIKMKIETSWLSFAGVQGYQRVYRMLVLGEYKSQHKLIVKAAYNFLDAYTQEKIVDSSDFCTDSIYGTTSATYGSESPYGGTANQYQIRFNFKKQKCESIKISIEDSQSSDYSEGLQISNLLFIVGAKRNDYKVSQSQSFGTK